jgi:hypothetical protein
MLQALRGRVHSPLQMLNLSETGIAKTKHRFDVGLLKTQGQITSYLLQGYRPVSFGYAAMDNRLISFRLLARSIHGSKQRGLGGHLHG